METVEEALRWVSKVLDGLIVLGHELGKVSVKLGAVLISIAFTAGGFVVLYWVARAIVNEWRKGNF